MAEVFTGTPGVFVKLEDTIKGFKGIVAGEYDDLPEAAFYMVGTIEEAVEKGQEDGGRGGLSMADQVPFELVIAGARCSSADRPRWSWCRAAKATSASCPAMRR